MVVIIIITPCRNIYSRVNWCGPPIQPIAMYHPHIISVHNNKIWRHVHPKCTSKRAWVEHFKIPPESRTYSIYHWRTTTDLLYSSFASLSPQRDHSVNESRIRDGMVFLFIYYVYGMCLVSSLITQMIRFLVGCVCKSGVEEFQKLLPRIQNSSYSKQRILITMKSCGTRKGNHYLASPLLINI